MEKKRNHRRPEAAVWRGGEKTGADAGGDALFNDWLEAKLRTAYSSVLDEPIPDDLIKLINERLKD